ncbi:MAG: ABC transporter permease [Rhodocyclaceae bacterium]|nr:ABC transporter permease [Rhodocyclaceae bacterium]
MISRSRASPSLRLFREFLLREISSRYVGSVFGGVWALIQPLFQLAIYSFVFRVIFAVRFPELQQHSFTTFVACALWPWMAFQEGLQRGTHAISGNASLIKKVAFRRELLVLAAVSSIFLVHLTGFVVVLLGLTAIGEPIRLSGLPVALLGWLVMFVFSCGLAFLTSSLQVFLKDVEHVLAPVLMVMFYATPVLYPLSRVPEPYSIAMALNPAAHVLEPIRGALMRGEWAVLELLAMLAAAFAVAALCKLVFNRLSPHFEDFA